MPDLAHKKTPGTSPTIVFLSGFRSDMEGTKAVFLESACRETGNAFVRFDYSGHGKSGGKFEDCTITDWKNDTLEIVDNHTKGDLILVGSSMGGWLMLLAALARPDRVRALIGIAAAPDFTEDLIHRELSEKQKREVMGTGQTLIPNCYDDAADYPITRKLIEDGANNLLLNKPIPLTCPVRLIHGMQDEDVPYQTSTRLAEKLTSTDVEIHLVKNGTHRMSEPENLELLKQQLLNIL